MLIVTVNRNVHTRARNDDKPWWAADLGRPLSGVQFTNKQLSDHSKEFHHRFDSPLDSPPASKVKVKVKVAFISIIINDKNKLDTVITKN